MFVIYYIVNGLKKVVVLGGNIEKIGVKGKGIGKKVGVSGNFKIFRGSLRGEIGDGMREKGI